MKSFPMRSLSIVLTLVGLLAINLLTKAQEQAKYSKNELQEFEFLSLCHCMEYLELRDRDYVAWVSPAAKKKDLEANKYAKFRRYWSRNEHGQYYQAKYDSTLFVRDAGSIVFGTKLKFDRLDSLYFEPIVQFYAKEISLTENLPYFGLGDQNKYFDCFFKVKEMPLEMELELFIKQNIQR